MKQMEAFKLGFNKQMEAFKWGFNKVFPIKNLEIFTDEELECLLCGVSETWNVCLKKLVC